MTKLRKIANANEYINDILDINVIPNVEFLDRYKITKGYNEYHEIIDVIKDIVNSCELIGRNSNINYCNEMIELCNNTILTLDELKSSEELEKKGDDIISQLVEKLNILISKIKNEKEGNINTKLSKAANDLNAKKECYDNVLNNILNNIIPTYNTLKNAGIGYGYDDTISYIESIKEEYEYILNDLKPTGSQILSNIRKAINLCNTCLNELNKWHDRYEKMPRETNDDMAELESYEYVADELVLNLATEINYINTDVENQIYQFNKQNNLNNDAGDMSDLDLDGSKWYNAEDGDIMNVFVNTDSSVYGYGNKFDFEAANVDEAVKKLKMWKYYQL